MSTIIGWPPPGPVVDTIVTFAFERRAAGLAHPEGEQVPGTGKLMSDWSPSDRELGDRGQQYPTRKLPKPHARTTHHVQHLIMRALRGLDVPPDIALVIELGRHFFEHAELDAFGPGGGAWDQKIMMDAFRRHGIAALRDPESAWAPNRDKIILPDPRFRSPMAVQVKRTDEIQIVIDGKPFP